MFLPVFLCGMPGSGKSTLGKRLAGSLNLKFLDLDREIELAEGLPLESLIKDRGEEAFRLIESSCLKRISNSVNTLVACGGGTPCFRENLSLMQSAGVCVFVELPLTAIKQRLLNSKGYEKRPLLAQDDLLLEQSLIELQDSRADCYSRIKNILHPLKESKSEMIGKLKEWMILAK